MVSFQVGTRLRHIMNTGVVVNDYTATYRVFTVSGSFSQALSSLPRPVAFSEKFTSLIPAISPLLHPLVIYVLGFSFKSNQAIFILCLINIRSQDPSVFLQKLQLILLCGSVVLHCVCIPQFLYPSIGQWASIPADNSLLMNCTAADMGSMNRCNNAVFSSFGKFLPPVYFQQ